MDAEIDCLQNRDAHSKAFPKGGQQGPQRGLQGAHMEIPGQGKLPNIRKEKGKRKPTYDNRGQRGAPRGPMWKSLGKEKLPNIRKEKGIRKPTYA